MLALRLLFDMRQDTLVSTHPKPSAGQFRVRPESSYLFSDNQDGCRIASSRNAPERVEHCLTRMLPAPRQLVNRLHGLRRLSRRDPNRLSCSIGEPAFPSRPGAAQATARSGGDWEERSHPEPRAARSFARAWRGWRAPDLPRSEHRGTLPPVEDRAPTHPLRSVTSRNQGIQTRSAFEESGACPGVAPAASAPNTILCAISRRQSFNRRCSVRSCPSG